MNDLCDLDINIYETSTTLTDFHIYFACQHSSSFSDY